MAGPVAADIAALFAAQFPQAAAFVAIEEADAAHARCRWRYQADHLRPGGTVSGPTLMTLADTTMYVLVLAAAGPHLLAVTSSLTIHFLRKPAPADLVATARLLKLGARLAVGEVTITSGDDPAPVAHATVSYALPAAAGGGAPPR